MYTIAPNYISRFFVFIPKLLVWYDSFTHFEYVLLYNVWQIYHSLALCVWLSKDVFFRSIKQSSVCKLLKTIIWPRGWRKHGWLHHSWSVRCNDMACLHITSAMPRKVQWSLWSKWWYYPSTILGIATRESSWCSWCADTPTNLRRPYSIVAEKATMPALRLLLGNLHWMYIKPDFI